MTHTLTRIMLFSHNLCELKVWGADTFTPIFLRAFEASIH